MFIVVDAYNMLKKNISGKIPETQREAFITKMATYAKKRNHHISLVFDGGSTPRPVTIKETPITISYSGYTMTADDIIKNIVEHLEPHNALLVTSDRALRTFAQTRGIQSIEPAVFSHYIAAAGNNGHDKKPIFLKNLNGKALKMQGHESSDLVDVLMQEASRAILRKDDFEEHEENTIQRISARKPGRTYSKQEKKIMQLLKKL